MKRLAFLLIALALVTACKKSKVNPQYESQGEILGSSEGYFTCAYCFGLEVKIYNDPNKDAPPYYMANTTLSNLDIDPNLKYPINVSLNWHVDTSAANKLHNYIIIDKIKVDN